jgi:hypothetical protein
LTHLLQQAIIPLDTLLKMNDQAPNDERKKEVAQQLLDIDLEVAREQIAALYEIPRKEQPRKSGPPPPRMSPLMHSYTSTNIHWIVPLQNVRCPAIRS